MERDRLVGAVSLAYMIGFFCRLGAVCEFESLPPGKLVAFFKWFNCFSELQD